MDVERQIVTPWLYADDRALAESRPTPLSNPQNNCHPSHTHTLRFPIAHLTLWERPPQENAYSFWIKFGPRQVKLV
jgi:hypothetical protein